MKKKVIRLKESDIVKIVTQIIEEQIGSEDNALAAIKPAKEKIIQRIAQQQQEPRLQVGNPDVLKMKQTVRISLQKLAQALGGLIQASGINPETNNLSGDLKKIADNFENLFGDPTPEVDEDA